jgi:putative phage-type endonuclease
VSLSPRHAQIRENRLGSSDTSAILNLNPWQTAYDVWLRLTGRLSAGDITGDQLEIGRMMEAPLIDWAADKEGVKVVKNQLRVHDSLPMSAQHDALIVGELRGMEAKTSGKTLQWGEEGTDQVPDLYAVQAHHQMIVSGLTEIVMPVAIFGGPYRKLSLYRLPLNPDLRDMIIERVMVFWKLVESDTPPESVPSSEIAARVIRKAGKRVTLGPDAPNLARAYQQASENEKAAKAAKELARASMLAQMVDAGEGAFELDGVAMLFTAKKSTRKGYTVKESEVMTCRIVKEKGASDE